MRKIVTTNNLLDWLIGHAPSRTLRRIISEGRCENMGFYWLPVQNRFGWVVRVGRNNTPDNYLAIVKNKVDPSKGHWCVSIQRPNILEFQGGSTPLFGGDNMADNFNKNRIAKQKLIEESPIVKLLEKSSKSYFAKIRSRIESRFFKKGNKDEANNGSGTADDKPAVERMFQRVRDNHPG